MSVDINKENKDTAEKKPCDECGKEHDSTDSCYDFIHSAQKFFDDAAKSGEDTTKDFDSADIESAKIFSALAYFNILFFLPLVAALNSRFGKFHANQALVLMIFHVVTAMAFGITFSLFQAAIPDFLGFLKPFLEILKSTPTLANFLLMIFGICNAAQGKAKELPLIGKIKLIHA